MTDGLDVDVFKATLEDVWRERYGEPPGGLSNITIFGEMAEEIAERYNARLRDTQPVASDR